MRTTVSSEKVFLLTGDWRESSSGTQVRLFGRGETGRVVLMRFEEHPRLFVPSSQRDVAVRLRRVSEGMRSLVDGGPVDSVYFARQSDLRAYADAARRSGGTCLESDLHPVERFLLERRSSNRVMVSGTGMESRGLVELDAPDISPCELEPNLSTASIDIETGAWNGQLYSIGADLRAGNFRRGMVFMVGAGKDSPELTYLPDERAVLEGFLAWFAQADPDLVIGWNLIGFDLAFLERKASSLGLPLSLGRAGEPMRPLSGRSSTGLVPGRVVIDVPIALRRSFYSFDDYKLESVARAVLGRGKLISGADRHKEIERRFRHDKESLAAYNLLDCQLVTDIVETTGLVELVVRRAEISGLLMERVGWSTAAFDHFYIPRLHEAGYAAPDVNDVPDVEHSPGGYVFEPQSGIYDDVVVLDFKSLYPSLIRTFHIEPLSRLLAAEDPLETPSGHRFSRRVDILSRFIAHLMEERSAAARRNARELSQAIKILMNSMYGVMGSTGCRFYHPELSSAITETGQWILRESRRQLEERGYKVVYGDTDSLFVLLGAADLAEPERSGERLAVELTGYWRDRIRREWELESALRCDVAKHYSKLLLPQSRGGEGGAKKRYAGLLRGADRLDFVGMEFVRSDWTALAKEFQAELCERVFRGQDYERWIRSVVTDVRAGKMNDKLIYRKRMQKPIEDYVRSVPPYVRAARQLGSAPAGREISYVITKRGPVPLEKDHRDLDYSHYIEKQLKPVADSILSLLGTSFDAVVKGSQLSLL